MRAITNITHYELSFYFKCIEFFKIFQILTTEQTMAAMHDCSSQFADNTSFQFLISYWTKEVQIDRDQSWSAFISIQNSKGYSCSHKLWGVWVWKKPARRCVVSNMGTEEPSLFEEASPKRVTRIGNRQPNALISIYLQQLFAQRETPGNVFF